MYITSCARRWSARLAAITVVVAASASCGIEKQSAPGLAGPSEFATSIQLTASPDTLMRDGASQSVIRVTVRDVNNAPVSGLALTMFANAGGLSQQQVVTGSDGNVNLTFTAPSLQDDVGTAVISAVPVGTNIDNASSRSVSIALLAPASASPSFTVTPASPQRFQLATLDASSTTVSGAPCGSNCTYNWTIGSEASPTGVIVTHRFEQEAAYVVTLAVTSPGGVTSRTQRTVTVGNAVLPTATFTFSPSNPVTGDEVRFNASSSTAANGATIDRYLWDFGNGQTAEGATPPPVTFQLPRAFTVRLTVIDSRGQSSTVTQTVTVTEPA